MKTVNVMVMLQIDIQGNGDDVKEVQDVMDKVNEALSLSNLDSSPQVFIENICEADIRDSEEFDIGDSVEMPEPNSDDMWNHGFSGTIVNIRGEYADVEDMEENVFTVELNRLTRE